MKLSRPAKAAFVCVLVIVILGILTSMARAQTQAICGPEAAMMVSLATKYGEAPIFSGDTGDSRIVMTVNSSTGTWTALALQGGLACIRAAGRSFVTMPLKPNA